MHEPIFTVLDATSPEPLSPRVYREIRTAIVTLRLRPGRVLSELDLARQFGASRQPVHDAFIRLQTAGLLIVRPQRGTMIARISPKRVRDAQIIRLAIEAAVIRRAAQSPVAEAIEDMRRNIALQKEAAARGEAQAFLKLDEEFHRLVASAADMEMAWTIIEDAKAHMDRVRFLSLPHATPLETLIGQHEAVLEAIVARNADDGERAIRVHLSEIHKSLPLLETRFPDLFDADDTLVPQTATDRG